MKKIFLSIALALSAGATAWAQAPQLFNYQGIARTTTGAPMTSATLGLRLTVHDGSASGAVMYQETQTATTNGFGLYNLSVGAGTILSGTMSGITWGSGDKYIQVEIDPTGGTSYTGGGTAQLLSVPYAVYSNTANTANTATSATTATTATTATSAITITGTVPMGGDVTGTNAAATVVKLQGRGISTTAPTSAQVLQWNSGTSLWTPATLPGGGTITGSGATNYVAKFTSATAIGNSLVFDNGTSVGVGTIVPGAQLHVSGSRDLSTILGSSSFDHQAFISQTGTTVTSNVSRAVIGYAANSNYENHGIFGLAAGTAGGNNVGAFCMGNPPSVIAGNCYGLYGYAANGAVNYGVYGTNSGSGYAGYFSGPLYASSASASIKSFKIDHPSDPANKYLYHSSVESNEMMNLYKGHVTTDASGEATVTLPGYFTVLNKDYDYQLTCIGQFAQAIVSEEIAGNQFKIKTDKPNVKVSWQVSGIRQDPAANAYRIKDEVEKPASEKGTYLMPELYGFGPEKTTGYLDVNKSAGMKK